MIGTPFYVMDCVEGGVVLGRRACRTCRADERVGHLRRAVPRARGAALGGSRRRRPPDLRPPGNYVARQIARWTEQYQARGDRRHPRDEALIDWLPAHIPRTTSPGSCTATAGSTTDRSIRASRGSLAVLDWELSTLGHPLGDLAYFCRCTTWRCRARYAGRRRLRREPASRRGGVRRALLRSSPGAGHRRLDLLPVFSMFRLAAIVQGVYKRGLDGNAASSARRSTARSCGDAPSRRSSSPTPRESTLSSASADVRVRATLELHAAEDGSPRTRPIFLDVGTPGDRPILGLASPARINHPVRGGLHGTAACVSLAVALYLASLPGDTVEGRNVFLVLALSHFSLYVVSALDHSAAVEAPLEDPHAASRPRDDLREGRGHRDALPLDRRLAASARPAPRHGLGDRGARRHRQAGRATRPRRAVRWQLAQAVSRCRAARASDACRRWAAAARRRLRALRGRRGHLCRPGARPSGRASSPSTSLPPALVFASACIWAFFFSATSAPVSFGCASLRPAQRAGNARSKRRRARVPFRVLPLLPPLCGEIRAPSACYAQRARFLSHTCAPSRRRDARQCRSRCRSSRTASRSTTC